ncbi:MAG: Gfo/Idh/MocA family oxidoreductase [Planctomycetota bacterium]
MIRVGVVGVGHLGKEHARIYAGLEGATLVGVFDADGARAREVADRHSCKAYTTPEALLDEVDAVSIAVPTPLHHKVALPFVAAGKALLVEKPLTSTLEEADDLIAQAERSGSVLQVGHIERFNPVVVAATPLVRAPLFIECDRIHPFSLRSTDVSVVLDLMIHDIDLVLHFTDDEIDELDALGTSVLSPTEDLATARLVFRGGCTAMVKTSRVAMSRSRKIRIFSERSYISLDLVSRSGTRIYLSDTYDPSSFVDALGRIAAPEGEAAFLAQHLRSEALTIPGHDALSAELSAFLDAAQRRVAPQVTGAHGRRAMAAAKRIEERMKFHRSRLRERQRPR